MTGRHAAAYLTALITFLDTLGKAGRERIRAISMDTTRIYREAARTHLPQAAICYDPFHLINGPGKPSIRST
ncbi:transposase [Rugosimonospora africana]|uniref:Transposase IS204/IS1001/IS1096/IS1165 DDE domain-containing protein n=1 Tax=Rugosimonospora africana TaxID=556532 RepID=A0A8J3VSH9_9ACTN|nr:transposase [Rugosimonospora africana]GIH16483.1 hypothetical protein Raf01_46550 [Rugosimonospora africana]